MRADSPFRRVESRERRSSGTRRRIYEAALAEIRRVGLDAAGVSRITRKAGVSRPSFYFHFPTKQHVLLELQWELEHEIVERIAHHPTAALALHGFVDELTEIETRVGSSTLFRDLLQTWVRPPEAVELSEHPMPVVDAVQSRFAQAAEAGLLRAEVPPERAALLFLTGVFGFLVAVPADVTNERDNLHALVDLYLRPASSSDPSRA